MAYETIGFGTPRPSVVYPLGEKGDTGPEGLQGPQGRQGKDGKDEIIREAPTSVEDFTPNKYIGSKLITDFVTLSLTAQSSEKPKELVLPLSFGADAITFWRACNAGPGVISNIRLVPISDTACEFRGYYQGLESKSTIITRALIEILLRRDK